MSIQERVFFIREVLMPPRRLPPASAMKTSPGMVISIAGMAALGEHHGKPHGFSANVG